MREKLLEFVKKYILGLGVFFLGVFLVVNFLLLLPSSFSGCRNDARQFHQERKDIPRLSEIKGPRIDGGGASIVREEKQEKNSRQIFSFNEKECATLPAGSWVLLVATYLFLIIFNLGSTFGKRNTVQWAWEAVYTGLALLAWFGWDQCRENIWFPLYVMAIGVSIYLFYLYFFWEKQKQDLRKRDETAENQKSLF